MRSESSLNWRKRALIPRKEPERFRKEVLAGLQKLEGNILRLKGKKRKEALEKYRRLLLLLKDEPIYLMRT